MKDNKILRISYNVSIKIISNKGFALVSTLFIMLVLVVVALGVSKLSTTTEKNISVKSANEIARANAKLALTKALAQLQLYAGADQRVTANASILDGQSINPFAANTTAPYSANGSDIDITSNINKQQWSGVWNTRSYIQYTPDSKEFMQWLVSGSSVDTRDVEFAENAVAGNSDFHKIFQGDIADNDVYVPLVDINQNNTLEGRYAYWTEDVGVKTNLSWNQSKSADDATQQALRLSSTSGPDFRLFIDPATAGPFDDVNFGTTSNSAFDANDHTWVDGLDNLYSASDLTLAIDDGDATRGWLKKYRHDLDIGSRGVLADMKLGGLKRDLSLAFEMDGTAENGTETSTPLFNEQYGEFVGGSSSNPIQQRDRLDAPEELYDHGRLSRYVYRDVNRAGVTDWSGNSWSSIFSGTINTTSRTGHIATNRGPTWWLLRDYANLYKRLNLNAGRYSLPARAYYPNRSTTAKRSFSYEQRVGDSYDYDSPISQYSERFSVNYYIAHPSRSSYAPVLLSSMGIFSLTNHEGNLAVAIDPVFYIWNPFNVALDIENYMIALEGSFPGAVYVKVNKVDGTSQLYGATTFGDFINEKISKINENNLNTYLVKNLTMLPGEVVIVSPSSNRPSTANKKNDLAETGTNIDISDSGVIFDTFPVSYHASTTTSVWDHVPLDDDDSIEIAYSRGLKETRILLHGLNEADHNVFTANSRTKVYTYLPTEINLNSTSAASVTAESMNSESSYGHNLQRIDSFNGGARDTGIISELITTPAVFYEEETSSSYADFISDFTVAGTGASLKNSKFFFGGASLSQRALIDDRSDVANPAQMAIFQHFNHAAMITDISHGRVAPITKSYTQVFSKSGSYNDIRSAMNVDFPYEDASSSGGALDRRGYYGESYQSSGSTLFSIQSTPIRPITSLIELNGANSTMTSYEPHAPFGESFASLYSDSTSPYGNYLNRGLSIGDSSWLLNDALFDRYYLSGIAPSYRHSAAGYTATSTLEESISGYIDETYTSNNPAYTPYLPDNKSTTEIVTELTTADGTGYKKLAAYAMQDGVFNVNSTSVTAWAALLKANRDLEVIYQDASATDITDNAVGYPFPRSVRPAAGDGTATEYNGFNRLSDDQIDDLATEIVNQVKLRGPFMSLSDFINRKVGGSSITDLHKTGTIQAALDASNIYGDIHNSADSVNYDTFVSTKNNYFSNLVNFADSINPRKITTGLPQSITQANILLPLVSKLNARSDTFRIRAYGESVDGNGNTVASATCEAVVQRLPEYVDSSDDPWDSPLDGALPMSVLSTLNSSLSQTNQLLGRRFKVTQFRWLSAEDLK